MYEFLFYGTLLLSAFGFYWLWWRSKTKGQRLGRKIAVWSGRVVCTILLLATGLLQGLRWFAPKGSWLYEAGHVAEYYFKIYHVNPETLHYETVRYADTHERNYMLVCRAKDNPNPPQDKIVFFVHGGGWHVGSPGLHLHLADFLAQKGYWVIMPAYRLGPTYGYPELNADIRNAFKKTLEWRTEKGLTDKNIIVGGTSAGGNLATLLVYDNSNWTSTGTMDSTARACIKGVFSIAGVLNMDEMPDSKAVNNYAGERGSPQFNAANPIRHLTSTTHSSPFLCLHGTHDGLVPYRAAQTFVETIKQKNTPVEFHTIDGGTHLSVAGQWYYNKNNYHQQEEIISQWIDQIN